MISSIATNLVLSLVGGIVYMIIVTIHVKYNFNLTLDISDNEVRFFMWCISIIIYFTLEYFSNRKLTWYVNLIKE